MIKHISFDVWNTLITANPEYAKARDEIIARAANIELMVVRAVYKEVKDYLDSEAEKGLCGSVARAWSMLGKQLKLTLSEVTEVKNQCNDAFEMFPPFFDIELAIEIKNLSKHRSLSIKSNTNFISGRILKETCMFDKWGFDFMHFSDHYQFCKPNSKFFLLYQEEKNVSELLPSEILHVGDNLICDGKCVDVGMQFCYVSSPEDLLNKLKTGELI